MAKKKRGPRKFTLPLAPVLGLVAGLAEPAAWAMQGNIEAAITVAKYNYLGLTGDNRFDFNGIQRGLVPLIVGALVHKFVGGSPLNVNRMLASANVPVLRI